MKKATALGVAALAMIFSTSVAFAKGKPPTKGGKSAPNVQYVLKGALSAYTPYNSSTSTNGSITILVNHSNYHGRAAEDDEPHLPGQRKDADHLQTRHHARVEHRHGQRRAQAPRPEEDRQLASRRRCRPTTLATPSSSGNSPRETEHALTTRSGRVNATASALAEVQRSHPVRSQGHSGTLAQNECHPRILGGAGGVMAVQWRTGQPPKTVGATR